MNWQVFIDGIKDEAGTLAKKELQNAILSARSDADTFIRNQGEKVKIYLEQLANGEITKAQFEAFIEDIRDLTQMKLDQNKIAAAAAAQRLIDGVLNILLDSVLKLI